MGRCRGESYVDDDVGIILAAVCARVDAELFVGDGLDVSAKRVLAAVERFAFDDGAYGRVLSFLVGVLNVEDVDLTSDDFVAGVELEQELVEELVQRIFVVVTRDLSLRP